MRILLTLFILCIAAPAFAQMPKFWQDPQTGFSISYPQTWMKTAPRDAGSLIRLQDSYRNLTCEVASERDERFVSQGARVASFVGRTEYGPSFWQGYFGRFRDVNVYSMRSLGAFGYGAGSVVEARFRTLDQPRSWKHGLFAVAHHYDRFYVFQCSTAQKLYDLYRHDVMTLLRAMTFKKKQNEYVFSALRPMDPNTYKNNP